MDNYNVEVGASNTITFEASTLREIKKLLDWCNGRVSVVDNRTNIEIYYGTPEQVQRAIEIDLEMGKGGVK